MSYSGFGATEGELAQQCATYGGVWNLDTQTCDMSDQACRDAGGVLDDAGNCIISSTPGSSPTAPPLVTPAPASSKLGFVGWSVAAGVVILGGAYLWRS